MDVVVVKAAGMPGQVGHELALAVDLPNVVDAPLAACKLRASRNCERTDAHGYSENFDGVVERAQLNVVPKHAKPGEDALGRLPIILFFSNFRNFSISRTQAEDPL